MALAFSTELAGLESVFREAFLKEAPLYAAASKVKLPFEDITGTTILYQGALHEEARPVHKIADYKILQDQEPSSVRNWIEILAEQAGHVVDGLIRLENVRSGRDGDPRNTSYLKVTDIFQCQDGRRNLEVGFVQASNTWSPADPAALIPAWIFYKFYFAAASIKQEYKASVAAQGN
jgi:hypothetical protein